MSVNLYSDQSRQVNWTVREDTDATMTVTCTTSAVATDLSSYTFIAEFYKVNGTTHFLQLTQGAGITNGGASGILTLALTDTQLNLTPGDYWWRLRTTAPTDNYWFNGIFKVNGYVWDGSTNSEVAVALTIGQTAINLALTIAAAAGGVTGSGTTNELAYFNSSSSIASLAVATYPNLTEVSYIKGLTSAAQTQLTARQLLVNSATALVDGATIDLTAIKHTLACSVGRTFTISYTGDDITLIITLSATSATFTFPATTLCVTNGTASGDNTMAFTGVVSGDKLVIAIKKIGSDYYAIGKNFGQ